MLTQVAVSAPRDVLKAPLVLPVGGPSKFPIAFIDGLGPVDSEISTSKYAIVCGEHFEGSRVNMRNIVITLDLKPNYSNGESAEQLRSELYSYFAPKHEVHLEFKSNYGPDRVINGWVESFEAPLFVQDPAVQISVLCPDPYLKATESKTVSGDLTSYSQKFLIENKGDISTSLSMEMEFRMSGTPNTGTLDIKNHSVRSATTSQIEIQNFPGGVNSVNYDSGSGRKILELSNTSTTLVSRMSRNSQWIGLSPGVNEFEFNGPWSLGVSGGGISISAKFTERYIGL